MGYEVSLLSFLLLTIARAKLGVCELPASPPTSRIPVVSLNETEMRRDHAASVFAHAMRTLGCVIVKGHSLDVDLIRNVREQAVRFFALPMDTKMQYHSERYGSAGYSPFYAEAVNGGSEIGVKSPDPLESFYLSGKPTVTPEIPDFHVAISKYRAALQTDVVLPILRLAAEALGLSDREAFSHANDAIDRDIFGVLKFSRYPPSDFAPSDASNNSTDIRYGAHTDWEGFTFLLPDESDDEDNGLQFDDGGWVSTGFTPPNAFIVNAGDFVPLWTDHQWKSPRHRVVVRDRSRDRLTIPFFVGPAQSTEIRSLIAVSGNTPRLATAGDWLASKLIRVQA